MTFAFPSLLWLGLPLLAAVVAVHLLNLRRQRPIRWAAMDFLLESERVNKAWINLRQWLLMAARLLLLGLAVAALAGPQVKKFTLAALADSRVMHVVVLDDSYSMLDAGTSSTAWQDAVAAVERIAEFASEHGEHSLVIVRTSGAPPERAGSSEELSRLRALLGGWTASQQSGDLAGAILRAREACESAPTGVRSIVYVVSDGRRRDLEPLDEAIADLEAVQESGAEVRWVSCVSEHRPNLTVDDLKPAPGPLAAGVEARMQVRVTNNGPISVSDALVQVFRDGRASPAIELGRVEPGETATRQFSVLFREPGPHRVTVRLDPDAVSTDNARFCVIDLAPERKVLLVDGSSDGREGAPFAAALRPGRRLNTGWRPELISSERLAGAAGLQDYAAVMLLDVPALSEEASSSLARYVRSGGGLLVAVGENANPAFYNQRLFGGPQGVTPAIQIAKQARPQRGAGGDLQVEDHPLFRVFSGDRDSFLGLVAVNYLHLTEPIEEDAFTRVIGRHASGAPLFVDSQVGKGRVVVLLTTVGQKQRRDESWSNLSALPVFPVLALEAAAYLSQARLTPERRLVGQPWPQDMAPEENDVLRIARAYSDGPTERIDLRAEEFQAGLGPKAVGYYRLERAGPSESEVRLLAVNVEPAEGDLRLSPPDELEEALQRAGVSVQTAVALSAAAGEDGPSPLPPLLAVVIVGLLLGEQALAFAASYHPAATARSRGEAAR